MADEGHAATDTAQAMLDRANDAAITSGRYKGLDLFVGGTGSGKSVTSEATPLSAERRANAIILESHAENADNLAQKIDKALEAGLPVDMHVVIRDPVEAYKSVVERYNRAEANMPGSGKVVPVNYGAATHEAVNQNVPKLMDRYAGDPGVRWHFIDNTGIPEEARDVGADDGLRLLGSVDTNDLRSKFNEVLDNSKLTKRDLERFRDQSLPSEFWSESKTDSASRYGDRNRIFTKALLERSQKSLRRKLNPSRLSGGVDPTALPDLLAIAGYHLEAGAIEFAEWSSRMVNDVGDWVKPHLEELYRKALQNVYWRSKRPGLSADQSESLRGIIAKAADESNKALEHQRKQSPNERELGTQRPRLLKARDFGRTAPGAADIGGTRGNNKNIMLGGAGGEPDNPATLEKSRAYGASNTEALVVSGPRPQVGSEVDETDATASTYSARPTHLSNAELKELMSLPHMKITDTRGAGAARPPRHHLFPQDNWEWFDDHEITIDRYTIEMNEGEHSAIHTMGWNRKVQDFIDQEDLYGERYTRWDIFRFMNLKRREFRLKGRLVVPYEN